MLLVKQFLKATKHINAVSKHVNAAQDHKSYEWSSTYLKRKIYTPPVRCHYSTWQGENSYQILE